MGCRKPKIFYKPSQKVEIEPLPQSYSQPAQSVNPGSTLTACCAEIKWLISDQADTLWARSQHNFAVNSTVAGRTTSCELQGQTKDLAWTGVRNFDMKKETGGTQTRGGSGCKTSPRIKRLGPWEPLDRPLTVGRSRKCQKSLNSLQQTLRQKLARHWKSS